MTKNKCKQTKQLYIVKNYIKNQIIYYDKYISRKEYVNFYNKYNEVYSKLNLMKKEYVLFIELSKNDCTTLKSDISQILNDYKVS